MRLVRYLVLLTMIFLGVAAAASGGLFSRNNIGRSARAYAVSTDIRPAGDRLMAHVDLRDLDSNRFMAGVHGYCTVDVPMVVSVTPSLTLELTVREAGNRTLRYVVELSGFAPEFRYEGVVSTP
jgi:hypothetical protein